MYSPSLSMHLHTRGRRGLAPCTSSVVLPLMPRWFERAAAATLASSAVIAVVGAAVTRLWL